MKAVLMQLIKQLHANFAMYYELKRIFPIYNLISLELLVLYDLLTGEKTTKFVHFYI